jgi:uncharacterized membrane protein
VDRSRLEAFSDGVFAVAITLLALNLAVPGPGPGHPALLTQLATRWPAFVAYLISFFMIGIIWVNHHVLVRSIAVVDRTLLFLNLFLLLFVVLIPFATGLMADYLSVSRNGEDTRVAMALYAAVFLGMSVGFGAIFEWTLHGQRVYQPLPPGQHWAARRRFVGGGAVYVAAIIIALFNAIAAFVLIALVAVYYIVERTPASPGGPNGAAEPGGTS